MAVIDTKLKIKKLELVPGSKFGKRPKGFTWKNEMYIVNDIYIASSIPEHNDFKQPWIFDFKIGEEVEVTITDSTEVPNEKWIKRKRG